MSGNEVVIENYNHGELLKSIEAAITLLGKTPKTVTIEDLGPVDEFHIGGREATDHFISQLGFKEEDEILDVGCGLGGAARFVADKYKSIVRGIDLTEEYIQTGNTLSTWVNLEKQVDLVQGDATSMPFDDESFDGAFMLHVGMNIEDKDKLFAEIKRVLKPGAIFGIYDIMTNMEGDLAYPVPWAFEPSISKLASQGQYKAALTKAGFEIIAENNRRNYSLEFFQNMKAQMESKGGPDPLGLHTLMQSSTPIKVKNMIENIRSNLIAPVEIISSVVDL